MIRSIRQQTEFKQSGSSEIDFKYMKFPSGEPHIQVDLSANNYFVHVVADILNFEDLGQLYLLHNALQNKKCHIASLKIPFFPCARQDRIANNGEALSVKVFADLINDLCLGMQVDIYDPHSDVTPALLKNARVHSPEEWMDEIIGDCQPDVLIAPDAGAAKKVNKLGQQFGIPVVQCGKVRDTKTGSLSNFEVYGNVKNKRCLLIDDISQGSRTHIELGKMLNLEKADRCFLYITHGFFDKGFVELRCQYEKIYTTNTVWQGSEQDYLKVLKII